MFILFDDIHPLHFENICSLIAVQPSWESRLVGFSVRLDGRSMNFGVHFYKIGVTIVEHRQWNCFFCITFPAFHIFTTKVDNDGLISDSKLNVRLLKRNIIQKDIAGSCGSDYMTSMSCFATTCIISSHFTLIKQEWCCVNGSSMGEGGGG